MRNIICACSIFILCMSVMAWTHAGTIHAVAGLQILIGGLLVSITIYALITTPEVQS